VDLQGSLHPNLNQLLGGGLTSRVRNEGGAAWVSAWLTWLALGSSPLMPKALSDPLEATLFAFPLLGNVNPEALGCEAESAPRQIERALDDRLISAWFEPDLHIESCASKSVEVGTEPLVAAFWQRPAGPAWLTCQATGSHDARVDGRSVKLKEPGKCRVTISALGRGPTRLVEDGWELPGLRLTCRGFEIAGAERSEDGLSMVLRPRREDGLLVFSPSAG
jgi:hypothetical protein